MKYKFLLYFFFGCILVSFLACDEKEPIIGKTNKIPITTTQVSMITSDSALGGGQISDDGGEVISERGICWSTLQNPTVKDIKASSGMGKGNFSVRMRGLQPNTTYYVRAYTISDQGEVYGNEVNFKTTIRTPTVATAIPNNITGSTAVSGGQVVSDGGGSITEKGLCWSSTKSVPTINDSRITSSSTSSTFQVNLSNLTAFTTYWVRAYAVNSAGIGYGPVISFRTTAPNVAELSGVTVSNLGRTTGLATSSVTSNGGAALTSYGVCISTSSTMSPRSCYLENGNILGPFSVNMTNLLPGTLYYVRAYANNAAGEGSSTAVSTFTTLPASPPDVITSNSSNISLSSATMFGNVRDDGGSAVLERGFYISTVSIPTLSSTKIIAPSTGTGSFSATATGLQPGTRYYYRAYARNSVNTSLSATTLSFTTQQAVAPTVTTTQETNVMPTSITAGGNVTNDGGVPVTARGIIWSYFPGVIFSNSMAVYSGSGTGSFITQVNGLPSNSYIYFRSFAENSAGLMGYGAERAVLTKMATPVLTSPAAAATIGCCYWYFSWQSVSGATTYQIQLSRDINFSNPIRNSYTCGSGFWPVNNYVNTYDVNINSVCLNSPSSSENGLWYWRVKAITGTNFSDWSQVRSFTFRW